MKTTLARVACFGQWIIGKRQILRSSKLYNQQQVRVDLFSDFIEGKINRAKAIEITKYFHKDSDRHEIHIQTEQMSWLNIPNPDYIFLDNFSELTDKRFTHSLGFDFCGKYGEFEKHIYDQNVNNGTFTDHGLLPINSIYSEYDRFFTHIKNKWGNVRIIFINFSTNFEGRQLYKDQGIAIFDAIESLTNKYNIQNLIHPNPELKLGQDFAYHFSDQNIIDMAARIIL
jgi:hypothetical protein